LTCDNETRRSEKKQLTVGGESRGRLGSAGGKEGGGFCKAARRRKPETGIVGRRAE